MCPLTLTAVSVNESDVVTVSSPEIQTCTVGGWPYMMTLRSNVEMSAKLRSIVLTVRHQIG